METSFNEIDSTKSTFPSQNGNSASELSSYSRGKQLENDGFAAKTIADSSHFLSLRRDGDGSDMDVSEDYPSETRAVTRKGLKMSVPLIRVEDWSSSESDMEDDYDESLPPFCFVGTRDKVGFYCLVSGVFNLCRKTRVNKNIFMMTSVVEICF